MWARLAQVWLTSLTWNFLVHKEIKLLFTNQQPHSVLCRGDLRPSVKATNLCVCFLSGPATWVWGLFGLQFKVKIQCLFYKTTTVFMTVLGLVPFLRFNLYEKAEFCLLSCSQWWVVIRYERPAKHLVLSSVLGWGINKMTTLVKFKSSVC